MEGPDWVSVYSDVRVVGGPHSFCSARAVGIPTVELMAVGVDFESSTMRSRGKNWARLPASLETDLAGASHQLAHRDHQSVEVGGDD